jgi:peptide/nickel transport system ATP-binding protein
VQNDCTATDPPDRRIAASHQVACHHSERTSRIAVATAPDVTVRADGAPLLRLDDTGKQFRAGWRSSGTWAVRGASFTIDAGEFVGLVGESGSGKSTLARLIMGLERPSTGTITLGARDVTHATQADARHRLHWAQMVFQDTQSALNPRRRVGDIVTQTLQAGHRRMHREHRMDRARELLAEVGLPAEFVDRYPAQLSGGQRQRVNIARALCAAPRLLVADEIVSGLDVSVQAQLIALLQRLRAELGIALLFISHDLSVVRHLCERVLVMHQGAIVEQGPTAQVFATPRDDYTRRLLAAVPPDDPAQPWRPFPDEAETTLAAAQPRAATAVPSG